MTPAPVPGRGPDPARAMLSGLTSSVVWPAPGELTKFRARISRPASQTRVHAARSSFLARTSASRSTCATADAPACAGVAAIGGRARGRARAVIALLAALAVASAGGAHQGRLLGHRATAADRRSHAYFLAATSRRDRASGRAISGRRRCAGRGRPRPRPGRSTGPRRSAGSARAGARGGQGAQPARALLEQHAVLEAAAEARPPRTGTGGGASGG